MDLVVFIDNTPGARGDAFRPNDSEAAWPVTYRPLGDNLGIAAAQNEGIRVALVQGFTHVLLLDQDSLLPAETVSKLLAGESMLLAQGASVAAVGPVFLDAKTGLPGRAHHHTWFHLHKPPMDVNAPAPIRTDWLIASCSLIRRSVLERAGLMRAELFIDAVDMEWGLRAKSLGLDSFVVPDARITHDVGDDSGRLLGVVVILHGKLRNYYIVRNWMYLLRLRSMGFRWRTGAIPHVLKFVLVHMWFSQERGAQLRYFLRALRDGITGRMGRYAERA